MRHRRTVAVLGCFTLLGLVGIAACGGGDDGSGSSPTNDAATGGSDTSTSNDGSSPSDASHSDSGTVSLETVVYVEHPASVDATSSAPAGSSFSWTIKSAPSGSTAALSSASTATPSITPDVVGDYVLTATVSGGATLTIDATVHARPGKVFVSHFRNFDGGGSVDIEAIRTDGTGAKAISCPGSGGVALLSVGQADLDWIEGAPDDDPRIAFGFAEDLPDGGATDYLGAGFGSSSCDAGAPARLDVLTNNGIAAYVRLSPDGSRIAYIRANAAGVSHVYTIGFDGSNLHDLGPLAFMSDGGEATPPDAVPAPRWADATHVEWVQFPSTAGDWSIVLADDTASPAVSTVMTCTATNASPPTSVGVNGSRGAPAQTEILEFEPLGDGTFLAAAAGAAGSPTAQPNLVVLQPNASTKACELVRTITSYADGFSFADDFAVSPDRGTVAYLAGIGDGGGVVLFTAPLDGGSATLASSFGDAGGVGSGPRWAAGGAQLVLARSGPPVDGGGINGTVAAVTLAAARTDTLLTSTATDGYAWTGNACAISIGRATPLAAVAFGGLFVGLVVRRRRRRK